MKFPRITFVLPCNGRGGGIRVTVEMARRLMLNGHRVRIVHRAPPFLSRAGLIDAAKSALRKIEGKDSDWISVFPGEKSAFVRLSEIEFLTGEVAIAVGEQTIKDVFNLASAVRKARYCHGFDGRSDLDGALWGLPMPTISVSPSLVPQLEALTKAKVLAVVPNGLEPSEYFIEEKTRDGLGLIYHHMPIKGPEVARSVVAAAKQRFPTVPWYTFGTARSWRDLLADEYFQYPSIAKSREIYNRCKVWLVTSRAEGFCLPALEAMACGCAVISSDHLNASTIIESGRNGFVVPYGNVDAYLDKIQYLLAHEEDRQKIVQRGFETVKHFCWDNAVRMMEAALETAFESQVAGPAATARRFDGALAAQLKRA